MVNGMDKKKETWWRSKGVYASACVMLVGVMAAGALFLREKEIISSSENMAGISTEVPAQYSKTASGQDEEKVAVNVSKDKSVKDKLKKNAETGSKKTSAVSKNKKSTAVNKTQEKKTAVNTAEYSFSEEKGLLWPVSGDVILKYSMTNSVFYKTLAQYKCNPGILIGSKVGQDVKAAAAGKITAIEKEDEHGMLITEELGNGYFVTYGQVKGITVKKGDVVKEGQILAKVAAPTKYYTKEGANLYFEVRKGDETVDPLFVLR